MKTTKYTERRFLGKAKDFSSKEEQRHEEKHLRAYLKGFKMFRDGYQKIMQENGEMVTRRDNLGHPMPNWFPVKEDLKIDEKKKKLLKTKQK